MSIYTILQAWDRFWFSEISPLSVAVYRILLGFLTIAFVLLLIPDLFVWFGSHGMCSNQAVADWNNGHAVFLNLFSFFPHPTSSLPPPPFFFYPSPVYAFPLVVRTWLSRQLKAWILKVFCSLIFIYFIDQL